VHAPVVFACFAMCIRQSGSGDDKIGPGRRFCAAFDDWFRNDIISADSCGLMIHGIVGFLIWICGHESCKKFQFYDVNNPKRDIFDDCFF